MKNQDVINLVFIFIFKNIQKSTKTFKSHCTAALRSDVNVNRALFLCRLVRAVMIVVEFDVSEVLTSIDKHMCLSKHALNQNKMN